MVIIGWKQSKVCSEKNIYDTIIYHGLSHGFFNYNKNIVENPLEFSFPKVIEANDYTNIEMA